jgi:hypothetical protein
VVVENMLMVDCYDVSHLHDRPNYHPDLRMMRQRIVYGSWTSACKSWSFCGTRILRQDPSFKGL